MRAALAVGIAVAAVACAPAAPPGASITLGAAAGDLPPAGEVAGTVHRLAGERFEPGAGAAIAIDGVPRATADGAGRWAVVGLAPGRHEVAAALAGHLGAPLAVRLSPAMGVARADLALVPAASGLPDRTIAGVVADPRGSAVPGAEVRVVDSASDGGAGGNRTARADAAGRFRVVLPAVGSGALTSGVAYLTATGLTPGGVRVETTRALAIGLDDRAAAPVAPVADAFVGPTGLVAIAPDRIRAAGLPTRRDELVLAWRGAGGEVAFAAAAIADGEARVAPPAGCCAGEGRLALLVFGIADAPGLPDVPWPPAARPAPLAPEARLVGDPGVWAGCPPGIYILKTWSFPGGSPWLASGPT